MLGLKAFLLARGIGRYPQLLGPGKTSNQIIRVNRPDKPAINSLLGGGHAIPSFHRINF